MEFLHDQAMCHAAKPTNTCNKVCCLLCFELVVGLAYQRYKNRQKILQLSNLENLEACTSLSNRCTLQ